MGSEMCIRDRLQFLFYDFRLNNIEDIHYKHDTRNNHAPINVKTPGGVQATRGVLTVISVPRVGIFIV